MVIKTNVTTKTVQIRYFALLREERGLGIETIETTAETLGELYQELKQKHGFALPLDRLRVAIKDEFVGFETKVESGADIILVPPVAGG